MQVILCVYAFMFEYDADDDVSIRDSSNDDDYGHTDDGWFIAQYIHIYTIYHDDLTTDPQIEADCFSFVDSRSNAFDLS